MQSSLRACWSFITCKCFAGFSRELMSTLTMVYMYIPHDTPNHEDNYVLGCSSIPVTLKVLHLSNFLHQNSTLYSMSQPSQYSKLTSNGGGSNCRGGRVMIELVKFSYTNCGGLATGLLE